MSNKMLIGIIAAIIVVCGAVAGYFYWQQTKPLNSVPLNNQNSNTSLPPDALSQQPSASSTAQSDQPKIQACAHDFDPKKLSEQVSMANRIVEIDVENYGKIQLEFYPSDAPLAVENFLRLTNSGFYDCLTFHRIAKNFVIQGGDPNGNGTGGISAYGKVFADELNPNTASYKTGYVKGVLAMANSGPNTNSSQFFIMLADHTELPHNYTIFGKVISGMDVVDKIGLTPINPVLSASDGSPVTAVVMQSVKIIK